MKALFSMLASTTSGRAKEVVKQGLGERNGMVAFGRVRERFGKTAVDARETLTIAGLEKAKERSGVLHKPGLCYVQAWTSIYERLWIRVLPNLRQWKSVLSCQRVLVVLKKDMKSRSVDCVIQSAAIAATLDISRRCAGNVINQMSSQIP